MRVKKLWPPVIRLSYGERKLENNEETKEKSYGETKLESNEETKEESYEEAK